MKILAVMVRFNTPLEESPTLRGLSSALLSNPQLAGAYTVMIWDNSPEPLRNVRLPIPFLYRHSLVNLGPSGAYNQAAAYASEHNIPWMLLLDQDTAVTADFLSAILRHARSLGPENRIAAIAPTMRVGRHVASPRRYRFNYHRAYPPGEVGIAPGEAFAINSGCCLRIAALRVIGGFSLDFWLDYSDMYVFHQFWLHGFKVWRAADAELQHDMTIMDYDRLMSPWRYRNYSFAEGAFNDIYKGRLENIAQNVRLVARAIRQRFKYRNPVFSQMSWQQLMYRLRVPRGQRIARWLDENRRRISLQQRPASGPQELAARRSTSDDAA